jgi:hypothetical protein
VLTSVGPTLVENIIDFSLDFDLELLVKIAEVPRVELFPIPES